MRNLGTNKTRKTLIAFGNNGDWQQYEIGVEDLDEVLANFQMDDPDPVIFGERDRPPWAEIYEHKPGAKIRGFLAMLYLDDGEGVPVGIDDLKHLQAFVETLTKWRRKSGGRPPLLN